MTKKRYRSDCAVCIEKEEAREKFFAELSNVATFWLYTVLVGCGLIIAGWFGYLSFGGGIKTYDPLLAMLAGLWTIMVSLVLFGDLILFLRAMK